METILRRGVASGISTKKIIEALIVFSGATRIEKVHPLQFGFVRRKVRRAAPARPADREPARLLSAPRCRSSRLRRLPWHGLYRRYHAIARRVLADPASEHYVDEALTPPTADEAMPHFVQVFADKIPKTHGAPPREPAVVEAAE